MTASEAIHEIAMLDASRRARTEEVHSLSAAIAKGRGVLEESHVAYLEGQLGFARKNEAVWLERTTAAIRAASVAAYEAEA